MKNRKMEALKQRILQEGKNLGRGILKIDSFLNHQIDALCRIVESSGATLLGITAVVEKTFGGGRDLLSHWQVPIMALAMITNMDNGRIELA